MTDTSGLAPFAFVIAVPDLTTTSRYFENALGFTLDWAESTDWRLLSRGGVRVMMGHCPNAIRPSDTGDHSYFAYLQVDDVDGLHAEFQVRGAIILHEPTDRPYGQREMLVATPDGHRIMIGQELPKPSEPT